MLKKIMDIEPNDFIVELLTGIVNLLHVLAGIALIVLNYLAIDTFNEIIDPGELIAYQIVGSVIAIIAYVILVGIISILISINRNLQRLVFLQNDTADNTSLRNSKDKIVLRDPETTYGENKQVPLETLSAPQVKQKKTNLHPYDDGFHDD